MKKTNYEPLKKDFRNFCFQAWTDLNIRGKLGEPVTPSRFHYALAKQLQNGPDRQVIMASRGFGKTLVSSLYGPWLSWSNPQHKTLITSAGRDFASEIATFILQSLDSIECIKELAPGDSQRQSKLSFDVKGASPSKDPSFSSVGILGQLPGKRADLILGDDIETPSTAETQGKREKLDTRVKEFESIIRPNGKIVYLGTSHVEDTLYLKLVERGYSLWIWPAEYPDEELAKYFGDWLAAELREDLKRDPSLAGKPTDPAMYTAEELLVKKIGTGSSVYRRQFKLDMRLADQDKYPLKVRDLIIMSSNVEKAPEKVLWSAGPDLVLHDLPNLAFDGDKFHRQREIIGSWKNYHNRRMYIDPSGKGKDETSYAVGGAFNSQIFLSRVGGFRAGFSEETLEALADIAAKEKVNTIEIESNFGSGMFMELFRPYVLRKHRCGIEEVRVSGQKELRIADTLEPILDNHRLIIDPQVIQDDYDSIQKYGITERLSYSLIYQMTRLSRDRGCLDHDDRLDALAGLCRSLASLMGLDADKKIEDTKAEYFRTVIAKKYKQDTRRKSWFLR